MKKLFKIISLLSTTLVLTCCGSNIKPNEIRSTPKKITDHLYEATYVDWNEDKANAVASILRKQPNYEDDIFDYDY